MVIYHDIKVRSLGFKPCLHLTSHFFKILMYWAPLNKGFTHEGQESEDGLIKTSLFPREGECQIKWLYSQFLTNLNFWKNQYIYIYIYKSSVIDKIKKQTVHEQSEGPIQDLVK